MVIVVTVVTVGAAVAVGALVAGHALVTGQRAIVAAHPAADAVAHAVGPVGRGRVGPVVAAAAVGAGAVAAVVVPVLLRRGDVAVGLAVVEMAEKGHDLFVQVHSAIER